MEIIGKAIAALPVKSGVSQKTGEQWQSREYVIETQEQYPKRVCFEVFGKEKLKEYNIRNNDLIKVYFDINAREFNGKWYNYVRAWKVEHISQGNNSEQTNTHASNTSSNANVQAPVKQPSTQHESHHIEDDMPF